MLYIDVTCARRWAVLIDNGNGSLVVNIEVAGARGRKPESSKDHSKAADHLGSKNDSEELCFGAGSCNTRLELALIGDGAAAKVDEDASDGATGGKISTMGSIQVSTKFVIGRKGRQVRRFRQDLR